MKQTIKVNVMYSKSQGVTKTCVVSQVKLKRIYRGKWNNSS